MKRFVAAMFAVSVFLLASCEKEGTADQWPQMTTYYTESCGLQSVPIDSVTRFSGKVDAFTAANPESKAHPLYPAIQANIKSASLRITITINDEWDGETYINY